MQEFKQNHFIINTVNYVQLVSQYTLFLEDIAYNQFHNILRLSAVLPDFSFTTSETICDNYL